MKKSKSFAAVLLMALLVAAVMLLTSLPAGAIEWYTANEKTVAWDPVEYVIGDGERLAYLVYSVPATGDKADAVLLGVTTDTQFTVSFTDPGAYLIGAASTVQVQQDDGEWQGKLVTPAGGEAVQLISEMAWSDVAENTADAVTFGIQFWPLPPVPLRLQLR